MTMVVVDTSVWIDFLGAVWNPHSLWLNQEIDHRRVALTDLTLCELLQGCAR